jgi:hypothetical protein
MNPGATRITIEYDGVTLTFPVGCEIDLATLSVEGYDIDFNRDAPVYPIELAADAECAPSITYETLQPRLIVEVQEGNHGRFETLVTVSDVEGIFTKTYRIGFYDYIDESNTKYPYVIQRHVTKDENGYNLNFRLVDNEYFSGWADEERPMGSTVCYMQYLDEELTPLNLTVSAPLNIATVPLNIGKTMFTVATTGDVEDGVATPLAEALIIDTADFETDDFDLEAFNTAGFDLTDLDLEGAIQE